MIHSVINDRAPSRSNELIFKLTFKLDVSETPSQTALALHNTKLVDSESNLKLRVKQNPSRTYCIQKLAPCESVRTSHSQQPTCTGN